MLCRDYQFHIPAPFKPPSTAVVDFIMTNLDGHNWFNPKVIQLANSPSLSKSLIALNLGKCNTIDSAALNVLGRIKNIQMLVISDINAVTAKTIESLCMSLEYMTALDISGCQSVTDSTLKLLAQSMRFRLISLAAGRNDNITHVGVNEVVLLCENMKHLDLSYCSKAFMGVVIRHISGELQHGSRSLTRICLDNNKEMNVHALDWICAANPDLDRSCINRYGFRISDGLQITE